MIRLAVLAIVALGAAVPAQAEHLYPRNECSSLAGFDQFQMKLATAVANRDAAMLRPLVSEQVHLDFGGGTGWELLRQRLAERDLWAELDKILALGCARAGEGEIALPWVYMQDFGIEDVFSAWLARGYAVPLRSSASANASLVRTLRWEAVEQVGEWQGDETFIHVRTRAGEEGYAPVAQLRHQLDYRLIATPTDNGWQITTFIAGD